jgi:hypothetical protein
MSEVDRRRIQAVSALEVLGYTFHAGRGHTPGAQNSPEADAMHALLI